jgi:hypothetical protein
MRLGRGARVGNYQAAHSGVDTVFVFAGQSNMDNGKLANAHYATLDTNIKIWTGAAWETYEPLVNASPLLPLTQWGPEAEFARQWRAANPNNTCYIVKWARGSTDLVSDWQQDGTGPEWNDLETYYNDATANLTAAGIAFATPAFLWMQGEGDATTEAYANAYETNLTELFASVRTLINPRVKIVVGRISYLPAYTYGETVRAAQKAVVEADGNAAIISTDALTMKPAEVHYINEDFVTLGLHFYQGYMGTYNYAVDEFFVTWDSDFNGGNVQDSTTATTVLGSLFARASSVGGTYTYSVVSDPSSKITLTGSTLSLENTVTNAVTYNFTVRATNNLGYTADLALTLTGTNSAQATSAWETELDSLSSETDGFILYAADSTRPRLLIRDATTPANDFDGAAVSKMYHPSPSRKWVRNASNVLVPTYTPMCDYDVAGNPLGIQIEPSATNLCLWSDDLTKPVWVKSNTTATKTATGPDAVANSATTITATSNNGTVLQTITSASAARIASCFIKRRTGSGTVEITQNNGGTWLAVTVTSCWTRVASASATLTNPVVGLRLATSGDAVDVAFFTNELGSAASSPIRTDSQTGFRFKDDLNFPETVTPRGDSTKFTIVAEFTPRAATGTRWFEMGGLNNTHFVQSYVESGIHLSVWTGGVQQCEIDAGAFTANAANRIAMGAETNNFAVSIDGAAVVTDVSGTMMTGPFGAIYLWSPLGTGQQMNGWLRSFKYLTRRVTDADLVTEAT